ncbi:MAG: DUF2085 domain-containing protein [Clostridiaceae bacterium]|nr:DUF2085 domain-containing protein [Clostridiaceae bacterium]
MDVIEKILYEVGTVLCHQLPSRTLTVGGKSLPVCARDTGIYIGMFIALMFLVLKGRWSCDKPPKTGITLILCLFIFIMGLDGITSYLNMRSTNNATRLITGGLFGISVTFLLIPIANYKIYLPNKKASLESLQELVMLTVTLILSCLGIYYRWIDNWWLISIISIITILFIHHRICYTLVIQVLNKKGIYPVIVSLILQLILSLCMYLFSKHVIHSIMRLDGTWR